MLFAVGTLVMTISYCQAQSWEDTVRQINQLFSRYADDAPGAQLAISRNGQVIYSAARGMANLEAGQKLTTTSKIEAGSVSKQFTAASILLLEQEGRLSRQDEVRKYVPELPDYGKPILIRHLINHTSGLRDWGSIAELTGWPRGTKAYNNEDALRIICQQRALNNNPGDEFIYSNSNYTLLTIIVQRVSRMSHAAFTRQNLFIPAGMKNTEWRDNYKRVVSGRAVAYGKSGADYYTNMPNEDSYGHGGLLTTAEDLLAWNRFYQGGNFGKPALLEKQLETFPLNNGKPNPYAAGLFTQDVDGWKAIAHSGATASYRANLEYFPEKDLSIAWISNTSDNDLSGFPGKVRALLIADRSQQHSEVPVPAGIDFSLFFPYLGTYREARTGEGLKLYHKSDGIYSETNGGPLLPLDDHTLAAGRSKLVFTSLKPRKLTLITSGGDSLFYSTADSSLTDPVSLAAYTGTYYSEEAEAGSFVEYRAGQLFLYQRKSNQQPLTPVYRDGFAFPGGNLYFERDNKGKIIAYVISISRARKVVFRKVK